MSNKAYKFALSKLGLKEIKGAEHNPEIIEMFAAVGHSWIKNDETPWCAAFVGWCLKKAGIPHLNEVAARRYEKYSTKVDKPLIGDIAVFWRKSKTSGYGHVGFVVDETKTHIKVLGGNQGNEVSIKLYPKKEFLSYRKVVDPNQEEGKYDALYDTINKQDAQIQALKEEVLKLRDANARMNLDFIEIEKLARKIKDLSE